MLRALVIIGLFAAIVSAASAQTDRFGSDRPVVIFNNANIELQTSLYPSYYRTFAATEDLRWVQAHSAEIDSFWQHSGDSVLAVLTELAGVPWDDQVIEISLLRYYPTVGSPYPMVMPVGGLRVGALTEAIPSGAPTYLNLIYQLAHRLLLNGKKAHSDLAFGLSNHPLAQPGPYYRDLLAFHLAYSTAKAVLGPDSAAVAYQSSFWKRYLPGRDLYEQYLQNTWQLTADKPLLAWLAKEPYDSRIVQAVAPLADQTEVEVRRQTVDGLPDKGMLGFSVKINDKNSLVIDKIDNGRLGYKAGLRSGDVITRVAGLRPRTHKELMELLIDGLERGSVSVQVSRSGKSETVLIRK